MSKLSHCLLVFASLACSGCVSTPPLAQATGTEHSNIFIKDVVERVKCELSDAFDKKIQEKDFLWLADWTAHVDLTLTINNNAGISPTGSYQHFQNNAVNFDAGPSTFPATLARAVVNQTFTVSAGATLSGQAVRTETVSFTLALNELRAWRENIDRRESSPKFADQRICNFGSAVGVTGNLGLDEWVQSALYPAGRDLKAGVHSATGAKANAPQIPQAGRSGASSANTLTAQGLRDLLREYSDFLAELAVEQAQVAGADDIKKQIATTQSLIAAEMLNVKDYRYVLESYLKPRYRRVNALYGEYVHSAGQCIVIETKLNEDIKTARSYIVDLTEAVRDWDDDLFLNAIPAFRLETPNNAGEKYRNLREMMYQLEAGVPIRSKPEIAKSQYARALRECDDVTKALAELPATLPKNVDPPIDSLLHSVTFVIDYGANVTPSWTLLQWKGPGPKPEFRVRSRRENARAGHSDRAADRRAPRK